MRTVSVKVTPEHRDALEALKQYPRETLDDVIARLLDALRFEPKKSRRA